MNGVVLLHLHMFLAVYSTQKRHQNQLTEEQSLAKEADAEDEDDDVIKEDNGR